MKPAAKSGQPSGTAGGAGGGAGAGPLQPAARPTSRVMRRLLVTFLSPSQCPVERAALVHAPNLQADQCPTAVALDRKFDRATAHLAIFHVGRLVGRRIDACFQPFAVVRARDTYEFFGRDARPGARFPDRLQAVELIDAVAVEACNAPAEPVELGKDASFHHLRESVANCDAAGRYGGVRILNMRFVRAASLLACALAVGLSGCATNLGVEPPAGVNLAGNWKLDPGASGDPQKLLEHMRQEAYKIISRRVPDAPMPRPGQGGAAPPDPPEGEFAPQQPPPPGARRPDPLRRSPMGELIEE